MRGLITAAVTRFKAALSASGGAALVGYIQAGAGAVLRTLQDRMRERVSVFDFMTAAQIADVQAGTLLVDVTAAIQAAIESVRTKGGVVYFPQGKYRTSAPIVIYSSVALAGDGKFVSQIVKKTNTVGTAGVIVSKTGVNDNYNIDSILSVVHPAGEYAYYWAVRGLGLIGAAGAKNTWGVFAPRNSRFEFSDCYIENATYGWSTADSWVGILRHTTIASCDFGFVFADDGSHNATGDAITFDNTWAVDCKYNGYRFYGLGYSSFNNVACDKLNTGGLDMSGDAFAGAYSFNTCTGITINGMGAEEIHGPVIVSASSKLDISALKTFQIFGFNAGNTSAFLWADGSKISLAASMFEAVASPGNFYNMVVQNGAHIVSENSTLPSGGNAFVSYNGGSSLIETDTGKLKITNANTKNAPLQVDRGAIVRRFKRTPFLDGVEVLEQVPVGAVLRKVRVLLTANAVGSFTALQVGNQNAANAYFSFDARTQALNTWVEYLPIPGTDTTPDANTWQITVKMTGGALGCAGIVEFEYYMP